MKSILQSIKILLLFTLLTGVFYPALVTGLAQLMFPSQANGSLVSAQGRIVGSALIGQAFDTTGYFSTRPSAIGYNPLPSGGSNLGPTSKLLKQQVETRLLHFRQINQLDSTCQVPADMVFTSASGLDPDIPVQAALLQLNRIVKERNFTPGQKALMLQLIKDQTIKPQFSCLGEERINVLLLNLGVDRIP